MLNHLSAYVGLGLILLGLNCTGCGAFGATMPYLKVGEAAGDMLCASLEAIKNSRVLNAKSHVSEVEIAIAAAQDAETVASLMVELEKAHAELQGALKDVGTSEK